MQPYDDALVVTLKIGGYDVKKVLVDQGSGAEIMYPDLFRGLRLRLEDLTYYDSPLIGFDGKIVFLKGQIRLHVQAGSKVVEVNFIVVNAYSLYCHYGKTLTSCHGGHVFHPTFEGEVSIRELG